MTSPTPVYRSAPGVCWVDEGASLLVVSAGGAQCSVLSGAEAALWRWLHLDYSPAQILELLAALLGLSNSSAEERLAAILRAWLAAGWLEAADG